MKRHNCPDITFCHIDKGYSQNIESQTVGGNDDYAALGRAMGSCLLKKSTQHPAESVGTSAQRQQVLAEVGARLKPIEECGPVRRVTDLGVYKVIETTPPTDVPIQSCKIQESGT